MLINIDPFKLQWHAQDFSMEGIEKIFLVFLVENTVF